MLQAPRCAFHVVNPAWAGQGSPLPALSPSTQPYEYESESPTTRTSWGPEDGGGGGGFEGEHAVNNATVMHAPMTAEPFPILSGARTNFTSTCSRHHR